MKTKRMRSRRRAAAPALLFLLPSLLGTALFVLIPFADTLRRSFMDAMGRAYVGWVNYASVFTNDAFALAAGNTARFAAICIPLLLAVSLVLALLMQNAGSAAGALGATFLLPMAIPVASVALIWQVLFAQRGALSAALIALGLPGADWINTGSAFWVLIFSYLWRNAGYDMVLWRAGLSGIDPAVYEAAEVDGAGAWQKFVHVTAPAMLPTLFIVAVLSLLNSFKVFREAYLIAGNYPHESIYMLQNLFNNWFTQLDMQKLCAAAVLVSFVILLLIALLKRLWTREDA